MSDRSSAKIIVHEIPSFASEHEERAFWTDHEMSDELWAEQFKREERRRIVAWLRDTDDPHSLVYQAGLTLADAADQLAEEST